MLSDDRHQPALEQAARCIATAEALLISAGAGMGVDSGLPDFRSDGGFWRAYPRLAELGVAFEDMAQPRWFRQDARMAWAFYGHRRMLYRRTTPHAGFAALLRVAHSRPRGYFVYTSNVDGQFETAGFAADRVVACHGSIHHEQCIRPCTPAVWPAAEREFEIDEQTFRVHGPLPRCTRCALLARPNVLMFGDDGWISTPTDAAWSRLRGWLDGLGGASLAIVELGAGIDLPAVRSFSERVAAARVATLVRINPRAAGGPPGTVSIELPARAALEAMHL
jgi:NAD-dependent SIR2 family protein deacetylase